MSAPEENSTGAPWTAADALDQAGDVTRRIRSRRHWYSTGALVMAAVVAAFMVALASWPARLADVIIPGMLVVAAILAVLAWRGRTIPTASGVSANRVIYLSAGLMVVTMVLNRLLLPDGFSPWVIVTGLLPALPFIYLAWRVSRS